MRADNESQQATTPGAKHHWRLACLLSLCGFTSLADTTGTSQSILAFVTCCCVFLIKSVPTRSTVNAHRNLSSLTGIAWACATGNVAGTIGSALIALDGSTISRPAGTAITISALALTLCFALTRSSVGEKPGMVPRVARTALKPTTAKLSFAMCAKIK